MSAINLRTLVYDPDRGGDVPRVFASLSFDTSLPRTPEEAAKAFYAALSAYAEEAGYGSGSVMLMEPDRTAECRSGYRAWCVCWEDGPFSWATMADVHGNGWYTEPYYSFDLCFVEL